MSQKYLPAGCEEIDENNNSDNIPRRLVDVESLRLLVQCGNVDRLVLEEKKKSYKIRTDSTTLLLQRFR